MKKLGIFMGLFLFFCSFYGTLLFAQEIAPQTEIKELLHHGKKWKDKMVQVKGLVTATGRMIMGKNKGYQYCILKDKSGSLQVRFPLMVSSVPKPNDMISVRGIFRVTPYGKYLEAKSWVWKGKKKIASNFNLDPKTAKRLQQAMKVLGTLGKLRKIQSRIRRQLRAFGLDNPEKLLKENLPKIMNTLKAFGITEKQVEGFLRNAQKVYFQVTQQIRFLLKKYEPQIRMLQREIIKRLQKAIQKRLQKI